MANCSRCGEPLEDWSCGAVRSDDTNFWHAACGVTIDDERHVVRAWNNKSRGGDGSGGEHTFLAPIAYSVQHEYVVVRAEPRTTSTENARKSKGDRVAAIGERQGWLRLADGTGWMLIDASALSKQLGILLTRDEQPPSSSRFRVGTEGAVAYADPSQATTNGDEEALHRFPAGHVVNVAAICGGWAKLWIDMPSVRACTASTRAAWVLMDALAPAEAPSSSQEPPPPTRVDLLVIGAGPHALSLLTRLIDDEPDLLTEKERTNIARGAGRRGRPHAAIRKQQKKRFDGAATLQPSTLVIDIHGEWLAQWKADFAALDIRHTRSHADLHPCPFDFVSLRVWAETKSRQEELVHMKHIDRDAAHSKGYRGPFTLVGTSLFNDFCASLVERYHLAPLVRKGRVEEVRIVPSATPQQPCTFEVRLADGTQLFAKRVVCAMGPGPLFLGMRATLPWWAEDLAASLAADDIADELRERMQHSSQLTHWLRDSQHIASLHNKRILIVGGGQTAAHLALLALRSKSSRVVIAARRRIVKKPYDVDLECVGDRRGAVLGKFWKLEKPSERLKFIQGLRGGGSMNDEVYHDLMELGGYGGGCGGCGDKCGGGAEDLPRRMQQALPSRQCDGEKKERQFTLMEEVEVAQAYWDDGSIKVSFDGAGLGSDSAADEEEFDYVWLATGGNLDLNLVPILASLQSQRPITTAGGLPMLQPDLSWDVGCPLYVMGAFAGLQLGADALNLAGARSGGVLVARALLKGGESEGDAEASAPAPEEAVAATTPAPDAVEVS